MTVRRAVLERLARQLADKLWHDIDAYFQSHLHPHGYEHSSTGRDPVRLFMADLADVTVPDPQATTTVTDSDGYPEASLVMTFKRSGREGYYTLAPSSGGGGGTHESMVVIPPNLTEVPLGPINLRNKSSWIMAVNAASKGDAVGTATGIDYSIVGGVPIPTVDLRLTPIEWPSGERLEIDSPVGTAAVTITWLVSDTAVTTD